jgi:hypothetical protein
MVTQEKVRRLFDYQNGKLIRRVKTGDNTRVGQEAGSTNTLGYRVVSVDNRHQYVHRVVWLYWHGYLPEHGIDHINRDKTDNRIENLREVGKACNARNTGNPRNNTSGIKGIKWFEKTKKWRVGIYVSGRTIHLGYHADRLEAVCHRLAAEQALGWAGCDDCSPAFQYVQKALHL